MKQRAIQPSGSIKFVTILVVIAVIGLALAIIELVNFVDYRVIAFQPSDDMSVVETGKPTGERVILGREFNRRYELRRKHYDLYFDTESPAWLPEATISIANNDSSLRITDTTQPGCGSLSHHTQDDGILEDEIASVRYSWTPELNKTCDSSPDLQRIELIIIDQENKEVGRESISYSIQTSGYLYEIDAL